MEQTIPLTAAERYASAVSEATLSRGHSTEADGSGISWGAVIAGAFVAAALSLALLALGTGLGLSSVSPWSNTGANATTINAVAIAWLILMSVISSAMGGYLAGRLRTRWAHVHTDEVYFRDTAHGFLAWAVALVVTAAFLASASASMMGSAPSAAAATPSTVGSERTAVGSNGYFVDSLFRSENGRPVASDPAMPGEAARIFANALSQGNLTEWDRSYLARTVAATTGLSQPEAEKRVSDVFAATQQAADTTRKAVAHSLLWMFLALLVGAFCASVAATIGGRQRDHVVAV